eukprot:5688342-Prymnesium_polylepis.2
MTSNAAILGAALAVGAGWRVCLHGADGLPGRRGRPHGRAIAAPAHKLRRSSAFGVGGGGGGGIELWGFHMIGIVPRSR